MVVKNTSSGATVESLTTDAQGFASLTDASYSTTDGIHAVVSKTGYYSQTVYLNTSTPGDIVPVRLAAVPDIPTFTLIGRLVTSSGLPRANKTVTCKVVGNVSREIDGDVYFMERQSNVIAMTDASGVFTFTFISGAVVQPVNFATIFGYPDGTTWVMTENRELGDGSGGTL